MSVFFGFGGCSPLSLSVWWLSSDERLPRDLRQAGRSAAQHEDARVHARGTSHKPRHDLDNIPPTTLIGKTQGRYHTKHISPRKTRHALPSSPLKTRQSAAAFPPPPFP